MLVYVLYIIFYGWLDCQNFTNVTIINLKISNLSLFFSLCVEYYICYFMTLHADEHFVCMYACMCQCLCLSERA